MSRAMSRAFSRIGDPGKFGNRLAHFPGVTGFDGLYIERRATRCMPTQHLKLLGTKLAKNTLASVKSPYFGMNDFAFAYA